MKKNLHSNSGLAAVWFLISGALLLAGALGGTIKLPAVLQKQPPTHELQQAELELATARAKQAQAEAELESMKAANAARTLEQGRYAQGAIAGASAALSLVPAEHLTPEVKLARELVDRAENALASAFDRLPEAERSAWKKLVSDALEAKGREVEALKISLAEKDRRLAETVADKQALATKITALTADVQLKAAETATVAAKADTLTAAVTTYAEQKAAADKRAGGLEAYAQWLLRTCIIAALILAVGYIGIHFVLPSLAAEPGAAGWLVTFNKYARSIASAHQS